MRSSSDARSKRARGRTARCRFRTARRAAAGLPGGERAVTAPIVVGAVARSAVAGGVETGHEAHEQAARARQLCMGAGPTGPAAYPETTVVAARRSTVGAVSLAAPLLGVPLLGVA